MNNKTDINSIFEAYTVSRSLINEGHQSDAHFFETLDNVRMKVDTDDLDAIVDAMKAELGRNLTEAEIEHCEEYWTASEEDNESREKNIMRGKEAISAEQDSYYEAYGAEAFEEHYGFQYPEAEDNEDQDMDEGNIFERLENIRSIEELQPILDDFKAIIEDIDSIEAENGMIEAADLGIHLNRLFPDV